MTLQIFDLVSGTYALAERVPRQGARFPGTPPAPPCFPVPRFLLLTSYFFTMTYSLLPALFPPSQAAAPPALPEGEPRGTGVRQKEASLV